MSGHLGQLQFLFVFRFRNCFISITARALHSEAEKSSPPRPNTVLPASPELILSPSSCLRLLITIPDNATGCL